MFLAFQYPTAIPGLSVASFIRSALNAKLQGIDKNPDIDPTDAIKGGVSMMDFRKKMRSQARHSCGWTRRSPRAT